MRIDCINYNQYLRLSYNSIGTYYINSFSLI